MTSTTEQTVQLPAAFRMISSEVWDFGVEFRRHLDASESIIAVDSRLIDLSTGTDYTGAPGTGLIGSPTLAGSQIFQTVGLLPKGSYVLQWHGEITSSKKPTEELSIEVPR